MICELDREELIYSGRIDRADPKRPGFVFPASSLYFRFYGKKAVLTVQNHHAYWKNYAGMVVDGVQKKCLLNEKGLTQISLVDESKSREHEILFFKRQDSCHEMELIRLELSEDARLLEMPEKSGRRIEVYGDSVSAGEVSEAVAYVGKEDPEHEGEFSNSWYSYAGITARRLGAELHDIAQGGIALLDGTGWFAGPDYVGMEKAWDKLHYNSELGEVTYWDFSRYTPQVVIVAIGQNDSNPEDYMREEYCGEKALFWRSRYGMFLEKIRKRYPSTYIVCLTTLLNHDSAWDRAIEEVCSEMHDEKITHYIFRRNGKGTPGHLRISEAEEMAEELAAYIESLEIEGW